MKIHIVQKGDTLWEIAKKYDVDFEELKQMNTQFSSPDMIMPGMKVKIPTETKTVKKEVQIKEKEMPKAEHPIKDTSPKPFPVMEEDDHKKPKEVKAEMPKQPQTMPEMPLTKLPPMQMPMPENLPEKEQHHEKQHTPEYKPMPEFMPPMQPMPMPQPVPPAPQVHFIHVCCCHHQQPALHQCSQPAPSAPSGPFPMPMPVHPCCGSEQYQQPTHHTQPVPSHPFGYMQHGFESPGMDMMAEKPVQHQGQSDYGCPDVNPMFGYPEPPVMHPGNQPQFQTPPKQEMHPDFLYPRHPAPMRAEPTPPGYPDFSANQRDQETDENEGE